MGLRSSIVLQSMIVYGKKENRFGAIEAKRCTKLCLSRARRIEGKDEVRQEMHELDANRRQLQEGPVRVQLTCAYVHQKMLFVEGTQDHFKVIMF